LPGCDVTIGTITATISRFDEAPQTRQDVVANIKSQIKRNRQNEKRHARNKAVRSELKSRTKTARAAIDAGAEDAADLTRAAAKRIDSAASKGVIHKNAAARRKSRLMRRLAAGSSSEG
jgi:small subunit ribosomal protein S20